MKHYSDLFKDKPTNIKNFENITTHKIIVSRHGGRVTLRIQNNLLMTSFNNVRSTFRPSGCVIIKDGFAIDNLQSAPLENSKLNLNIQYWPTEPYKANILNDYTFSSLREDILKRATNNGVTGRSLQFKKFVYLNLKIMRKNSTFVRLDGIIYFKLL